jgi:hypothetical protein
MRALPNQMSEARHPRQFVPWQACPLKANFSDLLDSDQLV